MALGDLTQRLARMREELSSLTNSVGQLSDEQAAVHSTLDQVSAGLAEADREVHVAEEDAEVAREVLAEQKAKLASAAQMVHDSLLQPRPFLCGGALSGEQKCGVAATLRGISHAELGSWLHHHLCECGFARVFLFFDEPAELIESKAVLDRFANRVCAVPVDARLAEQYPGCERYIEVESRLQEDWLARQELHVELAMRWGLAEGMMWLVHIDLDELFILGRGNAAQHFGRVGRDTCVLQYLNHEGVPEVFGDHCEEALQTNRFEAVTLFRRNPHCFAHCPSLQDVLPREEESIGQRGEQLQSWQERLDSLAAEDFPDPSWKLPSGDDLDFAQGCTMRAAFKFWLQRTQASLGCAQYFLAYVNGKGAARLGSGALPHGVHRFLAPEDSDPKPWYWSPEEACILHYAHGSCQATKAKFRRLRSSSGHWWKAFQLYAQCRELGDEACRSIYEHAVALDSSEEAERQIAAGVCFRHCTAVSRDFCKEPAVGAVSLSELD